MKKKLILVLVAIFALSVLALVACDDTSTTTPQDNVTVSFDINCDDGVNPQSQTVAKGAAIYLPSANRSQYVFDGWFTDATQGALVGKAGDVYVANADITLYAHWTAEQPKEPPQEKPSSDALLEILQKIQQDHPQSTYTNEDYTLTRLYAVTTQESGATVVYAKWTVTNSAVVTVREGADGTTIILPSERNADVSYTLKVTLTDKNGVEFTDADGKSYSAEFSHIAQRNMATVSFSSNYNGGANPASQTVVVGKTIKLPNASREKYTLNGWYTAAQNGDFVGEAGDDYKVTKDVTLYAYWNAEVNRTIVFYSTQSVRLTEITELAIANFEAKYPDWTIEHIAVGNYDDVLSRIRSELQSGLQPDLAYSYLEHVAQYLPFEKVVDLNKYLNSTQTVNGYRVGFTQEELNDFVAAFFNEGRMSNFSSDFAQYGYGSDALLCLPFVKSTEVLYYNVEALAELGISRPAATWEELWQHCELAKMKWGNCTPLGYDSESNWFITMAEQMGFGYTGTDANNHYLFNNAGAIAWLNQLKGYFERNYFTTQSILSGYTSNLFKLGPNNGGSIYGIASSGGAGNYTLDDSTVGVAPIPGVDASHAQCISQGPSLTMFTTDYDNASEREMMTFLFVKELLDVEFQAKFSTASGYMPARQSVYYVPSYQEFLASDNVVAKALQTSQVLTDRLFTTPAFVGATMAREQVGKVVQYVIQDLKTAENALADAYRNCIGG